MFSSSVSVQRTTPKTVLPDFSVLMKNAEYTKYLSPSIQTIIKLNLSWSLYYPACSTEPWQLEGVLKTFRDDGYTNIVATENRTVVTKIDKGISGNKWGPVLNKYSIPFIPLTETPWVSYTIKAETPAIDAIFGDTHTIPKFFIKSNIVHLPTIKTHGHTTMTGAMKNAFGGLITERRHHCHKMIHEILVDLLNQMIFMREIQGNILSPDASDFLAKWIQELEYINTTMRSIRKVQNDCSILDYCHRHQENSGEIYRGIVFDRVDKNDGTFVYMVYLEGIRFVSKIMCSRIIENYTQCQFKMFVFEDEYSLKKKVKLQIVLPE